MDIEVGLIQLVEGVFEKYEACPDPGSASRGPLGRIAGWKTFIEAVAE